MEFRRVLFRSHFLSSSPAQALLRVLWQATHAFGTLLCSLSAGDTNRKVWLRTLTSAIVCSIGGIWQATQSLPALPRAWCVCCSIVAARGPFGDIGPWQDRQRSRAGLIRSALCGVPCTSWQLKQVTPRLYIWLCTKSLPCIRFLCAVPSAEWVNDVVPRVCSCSRQ